jgi:exopolysaccharide biosynthesis predicted pyruvyltransferase EpsI
MSTGTKKRQEENFILYAFRQDRERKTKTSLPTGNIDLSITTYFENPKSFKHTEINNLALQYQVSLFLNYISFFDKVHTDRLHVALASVLLQKEIELFDNLDAKISNVYEHSLKFIDHKIRINW